MPRTETDAVEAIMEAIRQYLSAHPKAADSVDGIVEWWLRSRVQASHEYLVQQALERLLAQGVVKKYAAGGKTVYSRAEGEN